MVKLLKHQREVLDTTTQFNRVAIKGYEGLYEIDVCGNVYSVVQNNSRRKRMLKPYVKNGYLAINLYKDNSCKHFYIHRLVAITFIQNPNNYLEVNHKNCNKFDNSVENLEWCSRKQNLQHSYENGLKRTGEKHGRHKLTYKDVVEIRQLKGISQSELAKKYNVRQCTINAILRNKLWKEEVM